jgi:hypothetical protein
MRLFFFGLFVVAGMVGCGSSEVKFDATNAASAGKSFEKMTEGMTEDQRQAFMARASATSSLIQAKAGSPTNSPDQLWKGIHGMTKAQIEAKADELLPKKAAPAK